ncbi:MAG: DMT family transporter [Candidatus Verstraetearchaeota archaeon]|nr:DMT family transporter [Candidatus Verstraetearchaeota archaeon]
MAPKLASHTSGLLLIIIADLFWGTVFVASQIGLQYTNPYNLVFLRFVMASALIVALALPFDKRLGLMKELRNKWIWFFGGIYALGFLFQYVGQDLTTVSEATLLANLSPMIIPIFAIFLLKERITNTQKAAMVLALLGLLLIASPRLNLGLSQTIGNLLLFGASISYALFTVLNKKFNIVSIASSFSIIIAVTVFLAPIAIIFGGLSPLDLTIGLMGWASILYLGVPCTLVAISLYLKGLGNVSASEAAILFLFQVLIGLILSAVLLGDFLNLSQTLGAIAILAAMTFGVRIKNKA